MVGFIVYAPNPAYAAAAMSYTSLLKAEGNMMISALNAYSYLPLRESEVTFRVSHSKSTRRGHYIALDGSLVRTDVLRSHVITRLALYMLEHNRVPTNEYSHNEISCLFLYDLWFHVYSETFANEQKNRLALSSAEWNANWSWALGLNAKKREALVYDIMLKRHSVSRR